MSNVVEFKTAEKQCAEYVERQRQLARREAVEATLMGYMDKMYAKYGATLTVCAVVRWVSLLLVDGATKPLVKLCCASLAKALAKSMVRRVLTASRILH